DHLGLVFCSPCNQKKLVQTGFLVRACKYPLFNQFLRAYSATGLQGTTHHDQVGKACHILWNSLSYLSQFLTVFYEPRVKLKVITVVTRCVMHMMFNWLQPI
ncbi:hypothetical protein K443DRAFT_91593, partial [Laccaria amethystina LaAM-08-1]